MTITGKIQKFVMREQTIRQARAEGGEDGLRGTFCFNLDRANL